MMSKKKIQTNKILRTKRINKTFILHNFDGFLGKGTYTLNVTFDIKTPYNCKVCCNKKTGEITVYQMHPSMKKT